jgi:hypothetical protein
MFWQHRMHKIVQVHRCIVICHATHRYYLVITTNCITQTSYSHEQKCCFIFRPCEAQWRRTAWHTLAEKFLTRPCVSQTTKWYFHCLLVLYIIMNSHWSISCVADDERNKILVAILDFFLKTPIRFKEYDPLNDTDYIHIKGENSGCWSYVGRQNGVSSKVQGVVNSNTEPRTEPLGFFSFNPQHRNPSRLITSENPLNNSSTVLSELR